MACRLTRPGNGLSQQGALRLLGNAALQELLEKAATVVMHCKAWVLRRPECYAWVHRITCRVQEVIFSGAVQVGTLLESYEDADIPFFWFHSFGAFWVRLFAARIRADCIRAH